MFDTSEIVILIRKKIEGTISTKELLLLEDWASEHPSNGLLIEKVEKQEVVLEDALNWLEFRRNSGEQWHERMVLKTLAKVRASEDIVRPLKKSIYLKLLSYAAVVSILFLFGTLYFKNHLNKESSFLISDLNPVENRAYIILPNGHTIDLDEDKREIILGKSLTYEDGAYISELLDDEMSYLELRTAPGGQYKITLADGTKVWLNADSKLMYPVRFDGDFRNVELEGEAYFEVAECIKNNRKVPFIVKTLKQNIEVLGTHFNVMAYKDDKQVRTTLIEGSVQIHALGSKILLQPGEQAISDFHQVSKSTVDVDQYIGWKDNKFVFYETELKDAMSALSRWYDFEVIYEEGIQAKHFYGTISRAKSLAEVLKIMEAGGVRFTIKKNGSKNVLTVLEQNN